MTRHKLLILAISMIFLAGCFGATFTRDAYRTLATSAAGYQTARSVAIDLYEEGTITDAQRVELNSIARMWRLAYHAAIDAVELYEKGFQTVDDVNAAMLKVSDLLLDIQNLLDKGGSN